MPTDFESVFSYECSIKNVDSRRKTMWVGFIDLSQEDPGPQPDFEAEICVTEIIDDMESMYDSYYLNKVRVFYWEYGYQYDDTGNSFLVSRIRVPYIRTWWTDEEIKEAQEEADRLRKFLNEAD